MMKEMKVIYTFIVLILIAIQIGSVNAEGNPLLASSDWKGPDLTLREKDNSLGQRWLSGSIIDNETEDLRPIPLSQISPDGFFKKRPGTAIVTIISQVKGFQVYVDSSLVDTEGLTEPLDGEITIRVDGNLKHVVKITKGDYSNEVTRYFEMDNSYTIKL